MYVSAPVPGRRWAARRPAASYWYSIQCCRGVVLTCTRPAAKKGAFGGSLCAEADVVAQLLPKLFAQVGAEGERGLVVLDGGRGALSAPLEPSRPPLPMM